MYFFLKKIVVSQFVLKTTINQACLAKFFRLTFYFFEQLTNNLKHETLKNNFLTYVTLQLKSRKHSLNCLIKPAHHVKSSTL